MASKKLSKKVSAQGKGGAARSGKEAPRSAKKAPGAKKAPAKSAKHAKKAPTQLPAAKPTKVNMKKPNTKKVPAKGTRSVKATKGAKASVKKAPTKPAGAKAAQPSVKKALAKAVKSARASLKGPVKSAKKALAKAVKSAKATFEKAPALGALASGRQAESIIDVGARAPAFSLPDQAGTMVNSSELAGQPYVLYFYPKDDTPGCTREACDFRDEHQAFRDAGIRVFGVSPDSTKSHASFAEKYTLPFRLLSDPDKVLASAYGAYGPKQNYGRTYMGIIRSTFVVGADGVVQATYRGVKVDGHVQKVLARAAGRDA